MMKITGRMHLLGGLLGLIFVRKWADVKWIKSFDEWYNEFSLASLIKYTTGSSGDRFSKAPETFWARKAIAKFWTLRSQSCFIQKGGSLHTRSLRRIHFSSYRSKWSKNGLTSPKTFQGFRETGPRSLKRPITYWPIWCFCLVKIGVSV